MPAPIANQNALQQGMTAGSLPDGCSYIANKTKALRSALQQAVLAVRGEVSITDAAAINTAVRAERLAMLAQRWLRLSAETMSHDQRLAYARETVKASEQRDKAIRSLNLDAAADPMAALAAEFNATPTEHHTPPQDAAGPTPESSDAEIVPANAAGEFGPP